ncbi:hypothetical protein [Flavobacterium sp. JAS]|uniref:hypothetical protein n=1 Tax=Flavobacterium sp. JAS TaxID=2897329 RepID=UPI001E2CF735|nr:hypothetical protein [Flavobacterium sp. JAS]MCD0469885.1 hypothetical protein [Flavobacterium sp. JAS]
MKNFTLLFAFIFILVSCSSNDSGDKALTSDYLGKWTNVIAANDRSNPYVYRETYEFKKNNTFTKTRVDNNVTTTASGIFKTTTSERGISFKLTYSSDSILILNCSNSLTEDLTITKAGYLDNDGRACDAESMYEKTK